MEGAPQSENFDFQFNDLKSNLAKAKEAINELKNGLLKVDMETKEKLGGLIERVDSYLIEVRNNVDKIETK